MRLRLDARPRVLNEAAATRFAAPHVREVTSRKHMESLVGYCLTQAPHHGLPGHPATQAGSCFPDLVGARHIPGLALAIATALPRYRLREAYAAVGLTEPLSPASNGAVREIGPFELARAAAAALAVSPLLGGNSAPVAIARRAVVSLGVEAGLRPQALAEPLGITPGTATRLVGRPAHPAPDRVRTGAIHSSVRLKSRSSACADLLRVRQRPLRTGADPVAQPNSACV